MGYLYSNKLLPFFFSKLSPATEKAYRQDLDHFSQYLNQTSLDEAIDMLIALPQTRANLLVMHYKAEMSQQGLKTATINRRVSTLRSLVKEARRLKLIPWHLEVNNDIAETPVKPIVLTSDQILQLMTTAKTQRHHIKSNRDHAIMRLIFDLALKREIVANLSFDSLNLKKKTLLLQQSDQTTPGLKKLSKPTCQALSDWLKVRGDEPGPLFTHLDSSKPMRSLSSTSIYRIVRDTGARCGIKVTPDSLRQSAIFKLMKHAETLGIDEKDLLTFSDHQSVASLKRYRTQKLSIQEKLTNLVSDY